MVNYRGIAKSFDNFSKEERAEIVKEPHHIEFYREPDGHYMIIRPIRPMIREFDQDIKRELK